MPRINNPNYLKFLKEGIIETVGEDELRQALENVKGKYQTMGRAILILLYYTGARPNEILDVRAGDISKQGNYVIIKIKGSKKGMARSVFLPLSRPFVKEFYNYAMSSFPDMFLFHYFKRADQRVIIDKKGNKKMYIETSVKLRYYVKQWFEGVRDGSLSPYFLRHNRFSKLSEAGASMEDIRLLKGGKDIKSVSAYLHLSSKQAKKVSRLIK